MPVRTTVYLPDSLHDRLRKRAEKSGSSVRSLIVRAIEQTYPDMTKSGGCLLRPLIAGSGNLGPAFPDDENPHDFVFLPRRNAGLRSPRLRALTLASKPPLK